MQQTITISLQEYECLRGHLDQAMKIFQSLGVDSGRSSSPRKSHPKETKKQKVEHYIKLIETGTRAKKPEHLKKIPGSSRGPKHK